jgi:two-component system chemotaxis sensor kinase CheA
VDAVVETLRIDRSRISGIAAARAIVHRDRTVPIIELSSVLDGSEQWRTHDDTHATVVIAEVAGQWVGIHVDGVGERMEVILKPLEGLLSGVPGITGTTLLGDGRILLVLDIEEILR